MKIIPLLSCKEFFAGDLTRLREIFNPKKQSLELNYSLAHATVNIGEKTLDHILSVSEVYYILKGEGVMHIDGKTQEIRENDTVYIPPNSVQSIENKGNTELSFLCIVDPAWEPEIEKVC